MDGPQAELQELGEFPLARPLRPFHPDVLPLLFAQAWPSASETALRLARQRALPDRARPPLAESNHHRELELAGGRGRVEVLRQGPELHSGVVQAVNHLQYAGQPRIAEAINWTVWAEDP